MEELTIGYYKTNTIQDLKHELESWLERHNCTIVLANLDAEGNISKNAEPNLFLAKIKTAEDADGNVLSRTIEDIDYTPVNNAIQLKTE